MNRRFELRVRHRRLFVCAAFLLSPCGRPVNVPMPPNPMRNLNALATLSGNVVQIVELVSCDREFVVLRIRDENQTRIIEIPKKKLFEVVESNIEYFQRSGMVNQAQDNRRALDALKRRCDP